MNTATMVWLGIMAVIGVVMIVFKMKRNESNKA
ncbi:MAG: LPXTG cell wall anchor domain-containing protein [Synergistaceae bacterium]|nr:LPXTG cell wall anchor domain-containing protein [Synergistaceae bacterium]